MGCGDGFMLITRHCTPPKHGGEECLCLEEECSCEDDAMDCEVERLKACSKDPCPGNYYCENFPIVTKINLCINNQIMHWNFNRTVIQNKNNVWNNIINIFIIAMFNDSINFLLSLPWLCNNNNNNNNKYFAVIQQFYLAC